MLQMKDYAEQGREDQALREREVNLSPFLGDA